MKPISEKFCQFEINEYCRDSKSYLEDIQKWKDNLEANATETLYLVAADVQSLYPSIPRNLVREGVDRALRTCSDYSPTIREILVKITMFCLENVVIQNDTRFYHQTKGIITGDNNSVSIANITLHYLLLPISNLLNKTIIFKRYIDDIMWISKSEELTNSIQSELVDTFDKNELKLVIRKINTTEDNKTLEFLDVNHIICNSSQGGFFTSNFVKPTAVNRVFLNGSSYHPRSIFKSIIFSESIRLRRLNELDENYRTAIDELEEKCYKSGFQKDLVKDMIKLTRDWKDRFSPPSKPNIRKEERYVWATHFPRLLKLSKKERSLKPAAMVTYKRPTTLGGLLTSYRSLAHDVPKDKNGSSPCGHCKLCGHYGGKNMVKTSSEILGPSGTSHNIQKKLTCKDYGIYVASCTKCQAQYVGQTVTSFSKRWNAHRLAWHNNVTKEDDRAALKIHHKKYHPDAKDDDLADVFDVTFVDRPDNPKNLDVLESNWISLLEAQININKTVLPKYR